MEVTTRGHYIQNYPYLTDTLNNFKKSRKNIKMFRLFFISCSIVERKMKNINHLPKNIFDGFFVLYEFNMATAKPHILHFYQIQWAVNYRLYIGSVHYGIN